MGNVLRIISFVFAAFLASSCATSWQNKNTKEIRSSMPKYSECQKTTPEMKQDPLCYSDCMDKHNRRGFQGYIASGICTETCTKPTGKNVIVDDWNCNYDRAKREGWDSI